MAPTRQPRERLIEAAIRLLEGGGVECVQARRLASEVGASTMAVYTHLGGMPELFEALMREGFGRLAARVAAVPSSEDAMVDFFLQGFAYRDWAYRNPQLYRLMFGLTGAALTQRSAQDMTLSGTISLLAEAEDVFAALVRSLDRVTASGRIHPTATVTATGQFLSALHGYVLLEIAGYFEPGGQGVAWVLGPLVRSLMVGLGADQADVERAGAAAFTGLPALIPPSSPGPRTTPTRPGAS